MIVFVFLEKANKRTDGTRLRRVTKAAGIERTGCFARLTWNQWLLVALNARERDDVDVGGVSRIRSGKAVSIGAGIDEIGGGWSRVSAVFARRMRWRRRRRRRQRLLGGERRDRLPGLFTALLVYAAVGASVAGIVPYPGQQQLLARLSDPFLHHYHVPCDGAASGERGVKKKKRTTE